MIHTNSKPIPGHAERPPSRRTLRRRWLSTFYREEDGAVVALTLFVLLLMLVAGGIATDFMRHEMERAKLQNTLDTATLAAAGAPFGSTPKDIVEDYFAKAKMSSYLNEIKDTDVIATTNSTSITASADKTIDTYLMKLSGVKQLSMHAVSTAERRVPHLEVAMVLDVSGSMGSNSKLTNLKTAAKQFVTTILSGSKPGEAVLSVVPFSWDVTPGTDIFDALNVDTRQNYSTCLEFDADDYTSAAIDPSVQQTQMIYTSMYDNGFGTSKLNSTYRTCYTEEYNEILAYQISETRLHAKINSLQANGNTSGHMGMKWGAALLDPKFSTVKTALTATQVDPDEVVAEGDTAEMVVSSLVGDVPAAYTEPETLKIIVMMGDGQNTYSNQFPADSEYRGPNSYLYNVTWEEQQFQYAYKKNNVSKTSHSESKCSKSSWECVYESTMESAYYLYDPRDDEYLNLREDRTISKWEFNNLASTLDGYISTERLSWEMAWGMMSPDFLDKEFNYNTAEVQFENTGDVSGYQKDLRMRSICTAIKNKGVLVYTIGFEVGVNSTAEQELKKCASSDAHYYRAQGINITDAFSSIASNVVNLRLTQ
ncbi:pilus assembly protein TadG-related protein [Rhodobacteraceae bacterium KMM 6894]|nr:pilus assembly protein TadG-related protein [Rhodobacteraceae bacterium KMM 6894]